MKIAFLTLGCKLNYAETSTYERAFVKEGHEVVNWREQADVYVINTCTVTDTSDSKSRNLIRKVHRINPDAKIAVTGCSAQLRMERLKKIEGVSWVFGAKDKSSLVDTVLGKAETDRSDFFPAFSTGERTRSFLKVQDGCNNLCAYCTVPFARGESRNAPISEIVTKAREIAAAGIREVVLTGVNTGDFGKTTGESFEDLLKALNAVEGIERYRISSIEPNLLTCSIVDWIASGVSKVLPHFHIPLQSGCDAVLERMGRRYRTADFAEKIAYIRKALEKPGCQKVFFGIDVIVGFPGETDEMFRETYRFLSEEVRPAFIHIFPYSRRPGTPAAAMPDQVQDSVKTERVEALEQLCNRLHEEFVASNKGCRSKVLFEEKTRTGMAEGWSENYIKVSRPYRDGIINTIEEVEL